MRRAKDQLWTLFGIDNQFAQNDLDARLLTDPKGRRAAVRPYAANKFPLPRTPRHPPITLGVGIVLLTQEVRQLGDVGGDAPAVFPVSTTTAGFPAGVLICSQGSSNRPGGSRFYGVPNP